jgi:DNA helicase-2/ATP-dependent DNA helicase PcrA
MIKGFIALKEHESVNKIARKAMFDTGYAAALEAENTIEAKSKTQNLEELISAIEDFENRSPDKSLAGYLTQIALISDIDSIDHSKGVATLMTLHLAKGLEFDNVFICGLEEGLFPIGESAFDPKELEEERRLMYVGMTRARKHLYLSYAAERMIFGKTKRNIYSRFLSEAGLLESKDHVFGALKSQMSFGAPRRFQSYASAKGRIEQSKENAPKADTDNGPYAIGVKVSHPVFGMGKIIDKSGAGSDLKLVVLFENGQWKKLLAKAANLSIC